LRCFLNVASLLQSRMSIGNEFQADGAETAKALLVNRRRVHTLASTPPLGEFPSEYRHPLWYGKTRMVSLPDGEKNFEDMFIRFDLIHERDRRTDRQIPTDGHCMTAKTALMHRIVW